MPDVLRRNLLYLVMATLSALVTTIGLAWALAFWEPEPGHCTFPVDRSTIASSSWRAEWRDFGSVRRISMPEDGNPTFSIHDHVESWSVFKREPRSPNEIVLEDARGWPFVCLRTTWSGTVQPYHHSPGSVLWIDAQRTGGIPIRPHLQNNGDFGLLKGAFALPTLPIPSAFIGNVIVWTGIWLLLPSALYSGSTVRRIIRRRANRCVECNYDLRHSAFDRCSECGADLLRGQHILSPVPLHVRLILTIAAMFAMLVPLIGARLSWREPWTIFEAALLEDSNAIADAIQRGADPNGTLNGDGRTTPLDVAVFHYRTGSIPALVQAGARSTDGFNTEINAIMQMRDYDTLYILLRDHLDPNGRGTGFRSPFAAALNANLDIEGLRIFLDHGAEVNPDPDVEPAFAPLQEAIRAPSPSFEVIDRLIDQGASVNRPSRWGITPLITAAGAGRPEILRRILEEEVDVNAAAIDGMTAFLRGCQKLDVKSLELLVQRGADPRARNSSDENAVFYARSNPDLTVMEWLVNSLGIDINCRNDQGETVLERLVVATNPDEAMIRKVLELGGRIVTVQENARKIETIVESHPLREVILTAIEIADE